MVATFNVDTGIPAPEPNASRVYPWSLGMNVGDSFYVAGKDEANRAWSAARVQASRTGMKFVQKRETNGDRRIWRIA